MKKPDYLQNGDKVAIVCTARKISKAGIEPAIKLLTSWGLEVEVGETIGRENHQFAGTDEERAQDFQQFLDDENIGAIFCARGGYGTIRVMDLLDFSEFEKRPKWIVGYSDITVLHAFINCNLGIETLHATMPVNFSSNAQLALQSLRKALFGEKISYNFKTHNLNRFGEASGEIIGGNLSIIYSLSGSKSQVKTEGKILFLEDLDEYLYHIDRMMVNLKRSGLLKNLKGLVVGAMSEMNDNEVPFGKTAEEIINEQLAEFDFPLCFGFPAGHIHDNRSLIFGRACQIEIDEKNCTLRFEK